MSNAQVMKKLEQEFNDVQLREMAAMTQQLTIAAAIKNMGTVHVENKNLILEQMFEDKGGQIPKEQLKFGMDMQFDIMIGDQLVLDETTNLLTLNPELDEVVGEYIGMLNYEKS